MASGIETIWGCGPSSTVALTWIASVSLAMTEKACGAASSRDGPPLVTQSPTGRPAATMSILPSAKVRAAARRMSAWVTASTMALRRAM